MKAISILIVDDEAPARRLLHELIATDDRFRVIGESADGATAIDDIHRLNPEVVLLDVQMPEVDGFDVIQSLKTRPVIIMVTAFHDHAIRAFDHHALDYVLKPIDQDRLALALSRAATHITAHDQGQIFDRVEGLVRSMEKGRSANKLVLKASGSFLFLDSSEIMWIESAGNYAKIHCLDKMHLHRSTMGDLVELLDPGMFVRIHRSYVINRTHLREISRASDSSDSVAVLQSGQVLPIGRSYRANVFAGLS